MGYSEVTCEMAGEPEITWKDYVDSRLKGMDQAIRLAREVMNQRLEAMNEIRAQLGVQASTFLTLTEYKAEHKSVLNKIESCVAQIDSRMETINNTLQGKAEYSKLEDLDKRVQAIEGMRISINEKIKNWGLFLSGLIVILELIFRYLVNKPCP